MQYTLLTINEFPEAIAAFLGSVHRLSYPLQGDTSAVAVVDTENGKYVVKRSRGQQFSDWLKREYQVLQALVQTPLPTPQPHVFVQRETAQEFEAWLVMDYLPGEPLITTIEHETGPEKRLSLLRAFGSLLAMIHRLPTPAELYGNTPWLDQTLARAEYNLLHYPVEGSPELLEQLKQHRPRPVPPTLIHGDFTVDNVLITVGKVTGIIDWAGGGMGDPRYDLALAIRPQNTGLFQSSQDRQAFFEGYGVSDLSEPEYDYFVGLYEFF